uniref:Multifunctional fusion protein n=1 Tax=Hadrurus spadix TaxID=141984 RepID=A0A1W7RAT0_9SCOR
MISGFSMNVLRNRHFLGTLSHKIRGIQTVVPIEDFTVENESNYAYEKGSKEIKNLEAALMKYKNACEDIPIIIGGEEIRTNNVRYQVMPFEHSSKVAKYYWASPEIIRKAIDKSLEVRPSWEGTPISQRIKLFLKAADLISGKYRMDLNASTMLGQGKILYEAEIDSAAELADFFRFNAFFAKELSKYQPISVHPSESKNTFRHRGIEGFIASISPFNFTAIGGNLASAPTLMGNVVLWKPSDTAVLSNFIIMKVLQEAGFPPGVINFVPAEGKTFGDTISTSPYLAGVNFTGSVATFRHLWKTISQNLESYVNFPRFVGECGGKNFHFVHASADVSSVIGSTIRSSFGYSGQKCSACSRMYVPDTLWPKIQEQLIEIQKKLKLGSPLEYDTYLSAVIDGNSFKRISGYIDDAKKSSDLKILAGGKYDDSKGYFIEPTIIQSTNPTAKIMKEELFGPVVSIFVYPEKDTDEALGLVRDSTTFALTGAVFSTDEKFTEKATEHLKMAAGNFYINDKSTGSVVGQQPFGGGRLSGTNDKAGGPHYLIRWTSPQVIKETFTPQTEWRYPQMLK